MSTPQPVSEPAQAASTEGDRFERWPLYIALGIPFAFGVAFGIPLVLMVLICLVVLVLPVVLIIALVSSVAAALRRRWRRAVSIALLPLLIIAWPFAPQVVLRPLYVAGLWMRFVPVYWLYERQVAALPRGDTPRQVSFDLGSFGTYAFAVIYDESDQVAFPLVKDDPTVDELVKWIDTDEEVQCWGNSYQMIGHYYACTYLLES
jgi:hypothetical protein